MAETKKYRVDAEKRFIHGMLVETALNPLASVGKVLQVTVLEDRSPWFKGDKAHVMDYELVEEPV